MKKTVFVLIVAMMTYSSCEEANPQNAILASKADSAKQTAYEYFTKGDYFQSLDYYYKALDQYRTIKDDLQTSKVTSNIGNVYSKAGYPSIALNFYHDALEQRKALDDVEGIAKLYYNIGKSLRKNHQNEKARRYLNSSDSIFDVLSIKKYKPQILHDLGITYLNDSNYIEAREYFQYAISVDHTRKGMIYNNIGYSYHLEDDDDQALIYYHKALKLQDDLRPDVRTRLFQNLGQIHQDQDSMAWYYVKGFNKDLTWIDDLYLATTNTLYNYHHAKSSLDSTKYYYDLEHQAALRTVEQRDELKRMFDLYQVKYAHHKEQARQQATLLEKEQTQKLLINGVISGILFLIILYTFHKKRMVREKVKPFLNNSSSNDY